MHSNILSKKLELIQWFSTLEDDTIIEKLMILKQEDTEYIIDNASEEEKASILKGIPDAKEGKILPHSSVKKLYKSGYNILEISTLFREKNTRFI